MNYWLWFVGVLTPCIALFLNARALSFSSYLHLCEAFSQSFRRVKDCRDDEDWKYEFGELLNLTENACHIYRSRIIWGSTRRVLRDYLVDLISGINQEGKTRRAAFNAITNDRTFAEIDDFAKKNNIKFLE
jgi:hypothetical protein